MLRHSFLAIALIALSSTVAISQTVPPTAANAEVSLKLTGAEIQYIGNALGRMPYQEVRALIEKIQRQLNENAEAAARKDKPDAQTGQQQEPQR